MITLEIIQNACHNDPQHQQLLNTITTRFPDKQNDTSPIVKEYWEVHNGLSNFNGIALIDNRLVIPTSFRRRILENLLSAHQGLNGMCARAQHSV